MEFNFIWLLLGLGLLFWGKRLFWIFIGAAGFLAGLYTSESLIHDQSIWFYLIVGAICAGGLIGLVKLLKNIAFGLGGFILGAIFANGVLELLDLDLGLVSWIIIIATGVIGAGLMLWLFNTALVILSACTGAMLVAQAIPGKAPGLQILFFGLIVLGILAQTRKDPPNQYSNPLPPELIS